MITKKKQLHITLSSQALNKESILGRKKGNMTGKRKERQQIRQNRRIERKGMELIKKGKEGTCEVNKKW